MHVGAFFARHAIWFRIMARNACVHHKKFAGRCVYSRAQTHLNVFCILQFGIVVWAMELRQTSSREVTGVSTKLRPSLHSANFQSSPFRICTNLDQFRIVPIPEPDKRYTKNHLLSELKKRYVQITYQKYFPAAREFFASRGALREPTP